MLKIARIALAFAATLAVGCVRLPPVQQPAATSITIEPQPAQGMTEEQAKAIMAQCGDNNWCTYKPGDRTVVVEDNEAAK